MTAASAVADYNLLIAAIRARSTNVALYDINMDGVVNIADARKLVLLFTTRVARPVRETKLNYIQTFPIPRKGMGKVL